MAPSKRAEAMNEAILDLFCKNLTQSIMLTISKPRASVSSFPGGVNRKMVCCVAKKERLHIRASLFRSGAKDCIRSKEAKTAIMVNIRGTKKRLNFSDENWKSLMRKVFPIYKPTPNVALPITLLAASAIPGGEKVPNWVSMFCQCRGVAPFIVK